MDMVGALAWDPFHRVASGSDAVDGLEMATAERTDLADLLDSDARAVGEAVAV